MDWFQNIYNFFHSFFEFLSFRSKPKYETIEQNYEEQNYKKYEFVILNEKMIR